MKIYKDLFYTLLYYYKKMTTEKDVIRYPVVLLSFLISFNIWFVELGFKSFYYDGYKVGGFYTPMIIWGILMTVNYFIFVKDRERRREEYVEYLETRTQKSSIYTAMYIVVTFALFVSVAMINRSKLQKIEKQNIEQINSNENL